MRRGTGDVFLVFVGYVVLYFVISLVAAWMVQHGLHEMHVNVSLASLLWVLWGASIVVGGSSRGGKP